MLEFCVVDICLHSLPLLSAKELICKCMKKHTFFMFELINDFSCTSYFLLFFLGLSIFIFKRFHRLLSPMCGSYSFCLLLNVMWRSDSQAIATAMGCIWVSVGCSFFLMWMWFAGFHTSYKITPDSYMLKQIACLPSINLWLDCSLYCFLLNRKFVLTLAQ